MAMQFKAPKPKKGNDCHRRFYYITAMKSAWTTCLFWHHMRNLFQNALKSQVQAIDQNAIHLPKP